MRISFAHPLVAILILVGCLFLTSCGGASPKVQAPPKVSVTVSTSSPSILLGNSQQLTANVSGTSNTTVSWSVNGIAGGDTTVGTISPSGLYTAPRKLPTTSNVTVTAISQADSSSSASAQLTITSDIAVVISTDAMAVSTGGAAHLVATVSSAGNPDNSVTWAANGVLNGNAGFGIITPTGANTATYTAPTGTPQPNPVAITATSVADNTKLGTAPLSVILVSVSILPSTVTVKTGIAQPFVATVAGTSNAAVNWSVNGVAGGTPASGTISSAGIYTAPVSVPTPFSVTVAAVSVADGTKSGQLPL